MISKMLHCFLICEDCRNFFWHHDMDMSQEVVEYRRLHVSENSPSSAVTFYMYGLRRAACKKERENGNELQRFVERNFCE